MSLSVKCTKPHGSVSQHMTRVSLPDGGQPTATTTRAGTVKVALAKASVSLALVGLGGILEKQNEKTFSYESILLR